MKITIKLRWIIIAIGIAILAIGALKWVNDARHQLEVDNLSTELYASQRDVRNYEIIVDELTEYAVEIELINVRKDGVIFDIKEQRDRLRALNIKKVELIGELEARIDVLAQGISPEPVIDTDTPVDFIDGTPSKPTLKLPAMYSFNDKWVSTSTTIGKDGKGDIKFNMAPVPINLIVGEKGNGFLKKRSDVFTVTTESPYLTFDETKMVLVDNTTSPWTYIGVGAGGAVATYIVAKILVNSLSQ